MCLFVSVFVSSVICACRVCVGGWGGWGEGNELYVGYLCVGTSSAQTKFVSAVYALHRVLSLKA